MEQRAVSVFDTCLEQALQAAGPLMEAMSTAALASLEAKLLDSGNAHNEPLLRLAQAKLQDKKSSLPGTYARRLKQAAFMIAEGRRSDYHQQMGGENLAQADALESEVLRTQIEWGRVQINLLQHTEQSLMGLERVYRPLRKLTQYWRNGNPLHHTVYLDSLQAALNDEGITTDVTSLFLADMVAVMAEHLQTDYQRIMSLAMNTYAELLAKAEAKRLAARDSTKTFARRAKRLFDVPAHCPVGAVRAYKMLIPVLERLAAHDASFWDDASHPARLLVQTIVDKATAIKESGDTRSDPGFPGLVAETVDTLQALKAPGFDDFAKALIRFGVPVKPRVATSTADAAIFGDDSSSMLAESQWDISEPMTEPMSISPELRLEPEIRTVTPPVDANLAQMERDVMDMIAMSVHSIDADAAVLSALTTAWPKVLMQVGQRSGVQSAAFRAYRQVVPQVLALAGAHAGVGMHSEADVLIPSLLTRLKSGLTSIGWMPERIAPVLTAVAHMAPGALVELQVLEEEPEAPVALKINEPLQLDAYTAPSQPVAPAPTLSVRPARASTQGANRKTAERTDAVLHICGKPMRKGAQLEFLSQGEWVAKQLSWSNAQCTMFLFTSEDGASQSITRRMLEKLAQENALRPV